MATFSGSQGLPLQLEISHLNEVLVLLRKCGFTDKRWFELGLALGLSKNTLDTIEINYPRDTSRCLLECLSKWLEKADDVNSKGGATYESLSTAIRDMNENAVAENIEKEKCPEVLAVHIFNKHLPLLSKSLSDPVNVARLLYGEHVITQLKLHSVEDDSLSLSNKRQVLLAAVKDAIQADHVALQKFSIVLCHLTRNVKLGESILTDYGIYFPSNEETSIVNIQEVLLSTESSDTVSPTPKTVEVVIPRSKSEEFTTLRLSYAKMSYNVRKAIKNANIDLEDLKDFIISMDNKLEKKLEECQNISSTLSVIDKECSLIDIGLFRAVVENFEIVAADKLIKEYHDFSKEYFQSSPIACYLKEKLEASATCPALQCETVTYVFDWKPGETKLDDIKNILSKTSGKLVKIKYADTGDSISITCTFSYHLTGVLITQLMDNLQFLKKNDLKKLTIGYWIMWEREGKEEKETEQLLEEKEPKTSLKEEYQKEKSSEKKDNVEEQKAEAEKQLLLKRDASVHTSDLHWSNL
ncbi:PREDICTED: uncharacterized protein LOC109588638 [Amphimedon queenslandica]|uniref:Death domain-containing protein n=1 Tax=Amphimedon queenslandica TaxID=400682 RepID=A0AAN0JTX9_AMPQE|nr:PREDICTED: uncharacterized protein LOC109588638 [Amphimedon queenslandica]|eukprot:XP_019860339.1 PREDICTED: uncharacterized protein LOC109588638 [Amphimedon queenslandica]